MHALRTLFACLRSSGIPGVQHIARLCFFLSLGCGTALAADGAKRILVVQSNESALPAAIIVDEAFREGLQSTGGEFEIFTEFLDAVRFSAPEQEAAMEALVRAKYADRPVDLVVAYGPQALHFVLQRRTSLLSDPPLLFAGISDDDPSLKELPPGVTGVVSRWDALKTLELAMLLQPEARSVVVVNGASGFDKEWEDVARQSFRAYEGKLQFRYLSGLPIATLLDEARRLPPDAIVIYLTVIQDGAGAHFLPRDVAELLSQAASAPTYGVYDTYLGRGVVGGNMDTFEAMGTEIARLAARILSGEKPEAIPPYAAETHSFRVDWQQLRRWGLSESRLPPGTVVLFKQPDILEQYKREILAAIVLILLQSALIVTLLFQVRRRRRAEASLRESEERMKVAAVSADVGLWRWDLKTDKVWATEHCERMLGLRAYDLSNLEQFLLSVFPEDRDATRKTIEAAISEGTGFETEYRIVRPDSSVAWLSTRGSITRDRSGNLAELMGVVIDVTERREMEREAETQREELAHLTRVGVLGELSGALAHELSHPLASIFSNAEAAQLILQQDTPDIAEVQAIFEDILAEDRRADAVIQRMRAMLRKGHAEFQTIDLREVVADVLRLGRSTLIDRKVDVTTHLAPNLPMVRGDKVQLQQVLLNLIINACEAMSGKEPAERKLTIAAAPNGSGTAEITVSDRGSGIESDLIDRLFEPFVTTKTQGMGLGLSISRSIVSAHRGRLWAANNHDVGASFFVTLPSAMVT